MQVMVLPRQIEEMANQAKLASGYDGVGFMPIGEGPNEEGMDRDEARENRIYAEGVEVALRWVLGWADKPLPR